MAIPQSSIIALSLMYTKLPPSASDLDYWASPEGQAVSWDQAVQAFSTSSAAKTAYPMLASPNVLSQNAAARREYVIQAFQNLYGIAEADIPAEELTYWADTYLTSSPEAIFDFPVVLNQYSPASRQQALTNRAQVAENFAVAMAADGSSSFTSAQYSSGWVIVDTVNATEASVTAADAQIVTFIAGGGGGTGSTFTLLEEGAVLTESANSKASPAGQFLNSSNNTVNGLTFLDGSFVQDPSTADADILTAQILGFVIPNIVNIETVEFTGSVGATVDIINISGVKLLNVSKNNLQVNSADTFAVTLAAGYASNLLVSNSGIAKEITVNLNGTVAGTTITDLNSVKNVNLVVQADSVLKNADAALTTLQDFNAGSDFIISGTKNLTIDGIISVAAATDRLDASALEGKLNLNLGKFSNLTQIVGGKSDDTFTLTAVDDQITNFGAPLTINGSEGTNTLTVKVGNNWTNALNNVTNISTVVFKEAATDTTVVTKDSLVASGKTLTVDASSFTTKSLFFNGGAETDGSFKITGGSKADDLRGGAKNDILTGNGGNDFLLGNGGDDLFVLNKLTTADTPFIGDFTAVDKFGLSKAAYAGSPDVGATLVTSLVNAAVNLNTTVLVDTVANIQLANLSNVRFAYGTDNQTLLYDADGNFTGGSVNIAFTNVIANPLAGVNFSIVA
jgi:Ca2+-binding RTX toxin-like protein